ncbi:DUF6906 family protein [Lysinibacillus xylanilyticus]|uniref:DUF6906 family protein n=1 Tax=Lysinibacillus xylanilyticus TaxID=582475 RepID=UPI003D00F37D
MKRGLKLTVNESNHVKSFRLNPANWLISKKLLDEWTIVHRLTGKPRIIPAP